MTDTRDAAYDYDIALSFAGEDRVNARELAAMLAEHSVRVFFDEFEQVNLWGKDVAEHLHEVYSKRARYCVFLISEDYVQKGWPRHERRSALQRTIGSGDEYVLPVRLDNAEVPGLPTTMGYVRWESAAQVSRLILAKLG